MERSVLPRMSLRRSALRRAARHYASLGWPVLPGATFTGQRYSCGPLCPTVACHPAISQWQRSISTDLFDIDDWWTTTAHSVLLATGRSFDVIEVPAELGRAGIGAGADGPVAATPAGRWMMFVQPGDVLRPELADRLDVLAHGLESWVPAPPTRAPEGRVRWVTPPTGRLPASRAVQEALVTGLTSTQRAATFASASPRLRRAA